MLHGGKRNSVSLRLRPAKSFKALVQRFQRGAHRFTETATTSGGDRQPLRVASPLDGPTHDRNPGVPVAHIHRLPDELLIIIFEFAHENHFPAPPLGFINDDWAKILFVCKRWFTILSSVSHLWDTIPIGHTLWPLRFSLSHCGDSSLDIRIYVRLAAPALRILGPRVTSIRSLTLWAKTPEQHLNVFSDLLFTKLPLLEVLNISAFDVHTTGNLYPEFKPQEYCPRLRCLRLQNFIAPSDISRLRIIDFSACWWPFSWSEFLHALSACSEVVFIRLHISLYALRPSLPDDTASSIPIRVHLERLQTLIVKDYCNRVITGLLSHLDAPNLVSLRLVCYKTHPVRDEEDRFPDDAGLFRTLLPPEPANFLPKSAASATVTISFIKDFCSVKVCRSGTKPGANATVDLRARYDLDWTRVVPATLQDVSRIFRNTPVTALVVEGSPYHIPPAVWEELFTSLPRLRGLKLTGNGTWTAMWQGLHHASQTGADRLCCRHLEAIYIRHTSRPEDNYPAPPDERNLQIICDALKTRAEGGAKLTELGWAVDSLHHANYYAARGRFMARLSPYVERVTYEDLGQVV
ncbi:hypothetical protein C8Q77DRAFT_134158 [Trametes polyzona]|nr:hypothetical protein C8Q77DRAFT_134158 [Trametes polyzona]